ncbi:S41 family peptidase [Pedobacter sp. SYP-B3415]|uniref:S41 family peptidase n=1 Tax=Pedobacter sp. SYP-B3415 TaxID=2496641 RepID=UPI00101D0BD1|nr:S41 family peptidase [Pedobacter sp. SYP-B3415]
MLRKIAVQVLLVFFVFINACSQTSQSSAKKDIELMLSLVKISLTQQYFDKQKAADLVRILTEMDNRKAFKNLSAHQAAELITQTLRKETHDKHFSVTVYPANSPVENAAPAAKHNAAGVSDYRILAGNIGYMKWDFCLANDAAFREFRHILDTFSGCSKLIFDLSDNPGGDGASSAFLNQFLYRDKGYQTLLRKRCTGEKEWHQSEVIFDYTDGPTFFDTPLYIITSKNTFSAAEYFALIAKEMKRATILGETTAGAGNPGMSQGFRSPDTDTMIWLFIPNCQIITRSGYSLEGAGVEPDVPLKSDNRLQETLKYIAGNPVK